MVRSYSSHSLPELTFINIRLYQNPILIVGKIGVHEFMIKRQSKAVAPRDQRQARDHGLPSAAEGDSLGCSPPAYGRELRIAVRRQQLSIRLNVGAIKVV